MSDQITLGWLALAGVLSGGVIKALDFAHAAYKAKKTNGKGNENGKLDELADVVGTLIDTLTTYGILGA